ncbi:MAG TPA: SDR family NAD(P)-dependent oxidoreductase [Acidimicrobiales bacterium]|nr:SDR family NAD(P)-dependent oxidoreductase [Acidimicrobiales bacterium]
MPFVAVDHEGLIEVTQQLQGKRALVTGASRGIGAAVALRLAAEGAHVAITARTADDTAGGSAGSHGAAGSLQTTAARLRPYGGRIGVIAADLADAASRARIVPEAVDALGGPIDILVNNAAAGIYRPMAAYSVAHRNKMMEINVNAPIDLIQAVVPSMRESGQGWIVNVSSGTARHVAGPPFPTSGMTPILGFYGATKAALNRVTNAFALELHAAGVRVNTIEPRAAVATEGAIAKGLDSIRDDQFEPLEAMVEAVVALCSCELERTGQVHVSLDLLDELRREVMQLDGTRAASHLA